MSIEGAIKSDINCKYDLHSEKNAKTLLMCEIPKLKDSSILQKSRDEFDIPCRQVSGACKQIVATDKLILILKMSY